MYSFQSRIRYSETGRDKKLTAAMLLNYFQDCSTMQSEDLGIGIEYLAEKDQAWVLNFWQVDILRRPVLSEKVTILTAPYEFKGVMGMRNYMMQDEAGEKLAVANTIYTLLNMKKHVPCKPDDTVREKYVLEPRLNMEYLPRKIAFEGNGEEAEPLTVQRHHIDANDHVNNVQYINMAADLLPQGFSVKRILASYHRSALLGDVIRPVIHHGEHSFGVELQSETGESYCRIKLFDRI
ncbi:MAG: acyl-[acyl-carrier-protein] thioesterase [Lachnospiraceae bacterium]|nr:acyl-[acyl-carrier-protein] thioesterase [Lachnospiraceae bacterium]